MDKSMRLEPPWGAILCTTSAPWLRDFGYTILYSIGFVLEGIDEMTSHLRGHSFLPGPPGTDVGLDYLHTMCCCCLSN